MLLSDLINGEIKMSQVRILALPRALFFVAICPKGVQRRPGLTTIMTKKCKLRVAWKTQTASSVPTWIPISWTNLRIHI